MRSRVAVFRLAIAEAERAPEVARALDSIGREASRLALRATLTEARAAGLLRGGDPAVVAEQFTALCGATLMVGLLLGVAEPPSPSETRRRARAATSALLRLYTPRSRDRADDRGRLPSVR